MLRNVACLLLVALSAVLGQAQIACAQNWATKMFETTEHDFGSVAKGAKVQFPFKLENLYLEDVHIVGVSSSCGCTKPSVTKNLLKTYDEGAILAEFNTTAFEGDRKATLTVTIDKPFPAEVQLHVKGYIRRDVVLSPGSANFGQVEQGATEQQTISVRYAGRGDWKILEVKPTSPYIHATVQETSRGGGQVSYDLSLQIDPQAPAGDLQDQVVLVTDDVDAKTIPVNVAATIKSEISVSPSSLFLGVMSPGQQVTQRVVVTGKRPFRITGVKCESDNECFAFELPADAAKKMHQIPVTFTAGQTLGKVTQKVLIETDLGQEVTQEFTAYAQVIKPETGPSTETARGK